jgi:hypothetical protein
MGADASNPSNIHIYDASAKSWSTQSVQKSSFDPSNFAAILDHDTNVFCPYSSELVYLSFLIQCSDAYSGGDIFSLDMELLKAANSTSKQWNDVQKVDWDTSSYQPTMALAQNHIHFIGVPGVNQGSVRIFVIHCVFPCVCCLWPHGLIALLVSFLQPDPQPFGNFPNMPGKTASIFKDQGVSNKLIILFA